MRWLRNFVRRHTAAIPKDIALKRTRLLSGIYYFAAWNVLILTLLYTAEKRFPKTEEHEKKPAKWYATVMGTDDSKVYQFRRFKKVGEYEITGTKRAERGRTKQEREAEELENKKIKDNEKKYGSLEILPDNRQDEELLKEPEFDDMKKIHREDLNLLVEETNSL